MIKNEAEIKSPAFEQTIIAIGTSTGGPRALEAVLSQLPDKLPSPILIVQHIPAGFTKSLAERLNSRVPFTVKEAIDQEVIHNNTVYIAPGDFHMKVRSRRNKELVLELSKEAPLRGHRPSADILFYSIANLPNQNKVAAVLTGMGKDGAEGIIKLKNKDPNCVIIAESEETAIIYGMPKAAVNTNCVDHVLPLSQVGRIITNIIFKAGGK
ncbi:CheB methylesterase domain-containing protein [Virgibacillus oceani]